MSEHADKMAKILKKAYDANDPEAQLIDALTDLRHFANRSGLDFINCDRIAAGHYVEEVHGA